MFHTSVVLVSEETTYARERVDHAARVSRFGRATPTQTAPQRLLYTPKAPSPDLFADRFASVYPVLEVFGLNAPQGAGAAQRVYSFLWKSAIPFEEEEPYRRADHTLLFDFPRQPAAFITPYVVEVPDLNEDAWNTWQRPPVPPEARLFPFRQIAQSPPRPQWHQLFWRSPNWPVEGEPDVQRPFEHELSLYVQRGQYVAAPPPSVIRVRARRRGFFLRIRNPGDVFDIPIGAFSDATINYLAGQPGEPLFGWMDQVSDTTPLVSNPDRPRTAANRDRDIY